MAADWIYCHDPMSPHHRLPEVDQPVLAICKTLSSGIWIGYVFPAVLATDPIDDSVRFWISLNNHTRRLYPFAWLEVTQVEGEAAFDDIAINGKRKA